MPQFDPDKFAAMLALVTEHTPPAFLESSAEMTMLSMQLTCFLLKRARSDDSAESITKRLAWSRKHTQAALDWFEQNPAYAYHAVDGDHSVDVVHKEILAALKL